MANLIYLCKSSENSTAEQSSTGTVFWIIRFSKEKGHKPHNSDSTFKQQKFGVNQN